MKCQGKEGFTKLTAEGFCIIQVLKCEVAFLEHLNPAHSEYE